MNGYRFSGICDWLIILFLGVPLGIAIAGTLLTQDNFREIAIILPFILLTIILIYYKKFKLFSKKIKDIEV
jgi:hypothetical protein